MLTPRFEISQTEGDITVTIHAPYANVRETEIFVEEEHFRFYSPPYYLRLHLPGSVEETDCSTGSYDADAGRFVVTVAKVTRGQHFPDLDLLTTLLAPRSRAAAGGGEGAGIEVVGEPSVVEEESCVEGDDSEWFLEQNIAEPLVEMTGTVAYGFAGRSGGVFARFQGELSELLDLPTPDATPAADRWRLQVERERNDFCEMHYLADLMEPEYVRYLIASAPSLPPDTEPLPTQLQDALLQLPNREYLLSGPERRCAYLGLVDILFAFCYDRRVTEGEPTSESAWNVNKLSATLSWLQVFSSVETTVLSCVRRSLVYPLYRSWDLAMTVLADVQALLCAGKKQVLRCLLEIHVLFNTGELRYLLNRLYIQDYCVWVQQCPAAKLSSVASAISKAVPGKADLGLDLVELETAAILVEQEESQQVSVDEVGGQLEQLRLSQTEGGSSSQGDSTPQSSCEASSESSSSSCCSEESDSESESDSVCDDSNSELDSDDLSSAE